MKKLLLLFLLVFNMANAQITCNQTFTLSGYDTEPLFLNINPEDIYCYDGIVQSMRISYAQIVEGEVNDNICGMHYSLTLELNNQTNNVCPSELQNLDITNFTQLSFLVTGLDYIPDPVDIIITIETTFLTDATPQCDLTLVTPLNNSITASTNGLIQWSPAHLANGYYLSIGTTIGGTDIVNMANVLTTTYQHPTGLQPNTTYYLTITPYNSNGITQDVCETLTFTTCGSFSELNEDFDDPNFPVVPGCWTAINTSEVEGSVIQSTDSAIRIFNAFDLSTFLGIATPQLSNINAGTHRLRFSTRAEYGEFTYQVGVVSSLEDINSFTLLANITVTEDYTIKYVNIPAGTTGNYIVFKHPVDAYFSGFFIDQILWEPIPTTVPACVTSANIEVDTTCGNYPTTITWENVDYSEGYKISIGTTPGNYDIITNDIVSGQLFYDFTGIANQEYFVRITPFNILGDASNCTDLNFFTVASNCYCISEPVEIDGIGITQVQFDNNSYPIEAVNYTNLSDENGTTTASQGTLTYVGITFQTEYSYYTNIWIDFNDDYVFDESELVYQGESLEQSPTTLNASFVMPLDAPLGLHGMRIGTADYNQQIPNPCYNGIYGITIDATILVTPAPSCLPVNTTSANPSGETAVISWQATNTSLSYNLKFGIEGTTLEEATLVENISATSYEITGLEYSTNYHYFLSANCEDSESPWTGPFSFRTLCAPFDNLVEYFESPGLLPECWSSIVITNGYYTYAEQNEWYGNFEMSNSDDDNSILMLITPELENLAQPENATHRAKFTAFAYFPTTFIVGTMSNPTDHTTFTPITTFEVDDIERNYTFSVPNPTTDRFIAFKHNGEIYSTIFIDNFSWSPIPTAIPSCPEDLFVYTDEVCGNFATYLEWTPVEDADSYKLYAGTSSGNYNVVDGEDIGNEAYYLFTGNYNTTYFYKIVASNLIGDSINCEEGTFTTAEDGCYCYSYPMMNEGEGFTSIVVKDITVDAMGTYETYFDRSEEAIVNAEIGETLTINTNLHTNLDGPIGTRWYVRMWIDLNDDYVFDESEIVYSARSNNSSPTTLTGTFTLPNDNNIVGTHRVRISGTGDGYDALIPCIEDLWGAETVDFTINIDLPLSVKNPTQDGFMVYPNPANNFITIAGASIIESIEVYSILGQKIMSKSIQQNNDILDISELPTGTYIIKAIESSKISTVKFIKN